MRELLASRLMAVWVTWVASMGIATVAAPALASADVAQAESAFSAQAPAARAASTGASDANAATLDERVAQLSAELRCLVCQNQTVADSHAPLAMQLKQEVRKQLAAGASADEVRNFMVERYGDFVLYRPPVKASTLALWVGPVVILSSGLIGLALVLRKRRLLAGDLGDESDDIGGHQRHGHLRHDHHAAGRPPAQADGHGTA